MRILIVTDAWRPQVNGVVRTIEQMAAHGPALGAEISLLTPDAFRTLPMPTYPEIRLSLARAAVVGRMIDATKVEAVHISTEGPLGLAARRACLKRGLLFTTSYHTRFPEYLSQRFPIPERWTYAWLRRFHNAGQGIMVATESLEKELRSHGFERLMRWSRGVDSERFRPRPGVDVFGLPRPIFINVGRVAPEKNLEAFLSLDLPGSKVVVGDGPSRAGLQAAFPGTHFTGSLEGEALAAAYASADVFVFPSRTDTFGMVILEALASGLPVAAYPVHGPADIIGDRAVGALDDDLGSAALRALDISRDDARAFALTYGWEQATQQFVGNVREALAQKASRSSGAQPDPPAAF